MVCGRAGVQGLNASVNIRPADNGDLDDVARLWHESASQMDAAASPMPALAELRARIDQELAAGWELHLAERDDRLVGMLAIKPAEAILDQIFVLPEAQGGGVGGALLTVAKEVMRQGFTLRVASANRRAERFYERSGLRPIREGVHPISGIPVRYLRWTGSPAPGRSLP